MTGPVVDVPETAQIIPLGGACPATIYKNLRQSAAMAAGLEAMAVRALEVGESTEQAMEHIADLSSALHQELSRISMTINELARS